MSRSKVTLCFDGSSSEFQPIVRGIYKYARTHNEWEISLATSHFFDSISEWLPDGIIGHFHERSLLEMLLERKTPLISTSTRPLAVPCHRVAFDEEAIGRLGAAHLCEVGLAVVGYVSTNGKSDDDPTWVGFREVCMARGREAIHLENPFHSLHETIIEPMNDRLAHWFSRLARPMGIFVRNDVIAMQVAELAKVVGRQVPGDLSILGVGNNEFLCDLADPSLSSVKVPMETCGFEAARILDRLMASPQQPFHEIKIQPIGVVARRSTGAFLSPDPIFDQAILYIRENFAGGITIKDVVRTVGISRSTLERRFREHLGIVPTDEILRLRLQRASELLARPELSLRDVAMQSGFGDTRTLNHAMSKQFGMTAQEFRQQLGGKAALPDEED